MPNTYTQIHIHAVFAVQNRLSLIQKQWQEELYQYITGIITNNGHKLLQIGGMPDHIHVFFGMNPTQSLSELMQDIKRNSSQVNFHGRKVTLLSLMESLRLIMLSSIFNARKIIIRNAILQKNIWNY